MVQVDFRKVPSLYHRVALRMMPVGQLSVVHMMEHPIVSPKRLVIFHTQAHLPYFLQLFLFGRKNYLESD